VLRREGSTILGDLIVCLAFVAVALGLLRLGQEWVAPARAAVSIDLSPAALPRYAILSLSRGVVAYLISFGFTLVYGFWAAKSRVAERILIPILDVLQSIPVLGFMPGLVLSLVSAFPRSNTGLELAAVIMIFTGQAWNMTFSFYHSLRTVPFNQQEMASAYRFSWWQRLRWVELPFSAIGLVWNSMVSMAGGWFFLMIDEAFVLGDKDFRVPGLGSYMSVAVAQGDRRAMSCALLAMVLMIVALDQAVWRPLVVWAEKFRIEEGGATASRSWILEWLRRSRVASDLRHTFRARQRERTLARRRSLQVAGTIHPQPTALPASRRLSAARVLSNVLLAAAIACVFGFGGRRLFLIVRAVAPIQWLGLTLAGMTTLGRVLVSTALGTLWALPAGIALGLSPKASRALQPVIQVVASFPAPMLFPIVAEWLRASSIPLGAGSILLMLIGTQWYILFNVIAGATAIPSDLREMARSCRMGTLARFRTLYLPAVFPYLVTGWVTAAGGAWNASIVSEFITVRGQVMTTEGLGARISEAAQRADFALLGASIVTMSAIVVVFNRLVWKTLHRVGATKFSLGQ
jgi:NitT/TauT family transport system permease protein